MKDLKCWIYLFAMSMPCEDLLGDFYKKTKTEEFFDFKYEPKNNISNICHSVNKGGYRWYTNAGECKGE